MKVLGIDLGTSSSAAAVLVGEKIQLVPSSEKGMTAAKPFPSVVSFFKDQGCLIGSAASEQSIYNPNGTVSGIKRRMGSRDKITVFGRGYHAEFISALFLIKIKIDAEKFLNEKVTRAVITIPANFNDVQRQATKDAGRIAGLDVVRLMPEPVAAAVAYGLHRRADSGRILVFDMGAGTLDVSIVESDDGFFQVAATCGSGSIGGLDMDRKIERWLISEFKKQNHAGGIDGRAISQIRELARHLKIKLSDRQEVPFDESLALGDAQTRLAGTITREMFEGMIGSILAESEAVIGQVLTDAGMRPSDIDWVVPVGGPTKIPAIRNLLARTVKKPEAGVDPDFVVSTGAAIEGAVLANEENLPVPYRGLALLNVTPLDLGEEARKEGRHGIIMMIPRNTPYPTEHTGTFFVNNIMQTEVRIAVWQGDFEQNDGFVGNTNIGTFTLHGLEAGVQNEIEVTYGIDGDGILTVTAREIGTGTEQELVVDRAWENLGPPPQLEQAREEVKDFEKRYRDVLSPYEIPVDDAGPATAAVDLGWMCSCLSEAKNILRTHHHNFDPAFFDTARFDLFLQTDMQYAYAYIHLTGGPVYPIGIHTALRERTRENQRCLVVTLVHELLHAIHPDWGHNRIIPEERRLANLAGYFDAYREAEIKFLSGQMSFCNNSMTGRERGAAIRCND